MLNGTRLAVVTAAMMAEIPELKGLGFALGDTLAEVRGYPVRVSMSAVIKTAARRPAGAANNTVENKP